jgi:hypothetical protein
MVIVACDSLSRLADSLQIRRPPRSFHPIVCHARRSRIAGPLLRTSRPRGLKVASLRPARLSVAGLATSGRQDDSSQFTSIWSLPLTGLILLQMNVEQAKEAARKFADCAGNLAGKFCGWLQEPKSWVELLTLLFVGCYSCLTYQLVSNTRAQFESSERPWVGITGTTIDGYPTDTNIAVTIEFENGGKSPASRMWFREVAIAPLDSPAYERALKECEGKPADAGVGTILLPGLHQQTTRYSERLKPGTIEYIREQLAQKPKSTTPVDFHPEGIALLGCIDYTWDNGHCYRTRFCQQYAAEPGASHPYGFFFYCNYDNTTDENTDCQRN